MKPQRNAPCPCGSGKKYKRCCGQLLDSAHAITQNMADAIAQEASTQGASSIDALNRIAATVNARQNLRGLDDFMGLSPDQMSCLLYQPFNSPQVVTFSIDSTPTAPILRLYNAMTNHFEENGVKATAKKNLPLKLCQAIFAEDDYDELHRLSQTINTETAFDSLHVTRLTAEAAKLIALRKGRFSLTKKGKILSTPDKQGELYFELFKAYGTVFNWAYRDNYDDADIIQQGFLFTLYMLVFCGEQSRPTTFYAEYFTKAFPMIISAFEDRPYSTAQETANRCFILRSLERFAAFFGLIRMTTVPGSKRDEKMLLEKTALLDVFITFHG
ncbi:MAG: hypothetical protein GY814_06105 [Gammaproteobacteria bacterium]|nr:hypothetical protein [Gammaproteobacteria bacterium]